MEVDENGLVDGKIPIFSDVLAFIWNKMNHCAKDPLIDVVIGNFKAEEITLSRDILYKKIDSSRRLVRHRNKLDIVRGLYDVLQGMQLPLQFIFAVKDLNNIPVIDMKNIDSVNLICEQRTLKQQMEQVLAEQNAMKEP